MVNKITEMAKTNAIYANNPILGSTYKLKHLEMCNYNPTIGAIAEHQYSLPQHLWGLETQNIKYLKTIVKDRIDFLYPKTKHIRDYIIKDNRLNLDFVTRSRGYNFIDKLKIFLKR